MAEPHPAELTTTASTPACSNRAIVRRAKAAASASRPECSDSAPQQPCPRGMITSQPSAASTRAVAAFTCGKNTDCTHPVSMPTTARRVPSAGTRSGSGRAPRTDVAEPGGASRSAAPSTGETRPGRLDRASRRSSPVRCAARSGAVSARSRLGNGNREKMAARATRSRTVRPGRGRLHGGRRGSRLLGPHPGRLDELVVLHSRGTGRHAGHAAQAAVEVLRGRGGHRGPVEDLVHQVDPAPRRVHLLGPQLVGRAGRQAEPAVHAVLRHLAQRVLVLHQSPPTNAKRPGNIR